MLAIKKMLSGAVWCVVALALGAALGLGAGIQWEQGRQAKTDVKIEEIRKAIAIDTAKAISKIEVRNTTIRQEIQREIHKEPVYIDCNHTDVGMRLVNEALSGRSTNYFPLHGIDGIARHKFWSNDTEAD